MPDLPAYDRLHEELSLTILLILKYYFETCQVVGEY